MAEDNKILVVGGKTLKEATFTNNSTEFINSLNLALKQDDKELLSPWSKGHEIREACVYQRTVPTALKRPTRILFYDAVGLSSVEDQDKLADILRFLLEGKLKISEYKWALMQEQQNLIRHFKNIEVRRNKIFRAVIFLEEPDDGGADCKQAITLADTLSKAIKRSSKKEVNNIPILRTVVNGSRGPLTEEHKLYVYRDDSALSTKHNFGLPPQRIHLNSYSWADAYTDFDMDTEGVPQGYIQCQQQMMDMYEKEKQEQDKDKQNAVRPGKGSGGKTKMDTLDELNEDSDTTGSTSLLKIDSNNNDSNNKSSNSKAQKTQQDSGVTVDLELEVDFEEELPEIEEFDSPKSSSTSKSPIINNIPDNFKTNLTTALLDSPIPSIANLQMRDREGNNSGASNSPADGMSTPTGRGFPRSSSRSSSRRLSSPEVVIPPYLRQYSLPAESVTFEQENNGGCTDYNYLGFPTLRDRSVSSNFAKSSSMASLTNIAKKMNAEISDRFEFNYRIAPIKDKKTSCSLLLFLEEVLTIIFNNDHHSLLGTVWRLRQSQGTSGTREQPLGNVLRKLIGGSRSRAKTRTGRTN